eukprot:m.430674 g.430674  ORF g.430674 m.430674 type:complete len:424 (-) comp20240_c9_seq1:313-1584(-)
MSSLFARLAGKLPPPLSFMPNHGGAAGFAPATASPARFCPSPEPLLDPTWPQPSASPPPLPAAAAAAAAAADQADDQALAEGLRTFADAYDGFASTDDEDSGAVVNGTLRRRGVRGAGVFRGGRIAPRLSPMTTHKTKHAATGAGPTGPSPHSGRTATVQRRRGGCQGAASSSSASPRWRARRQHSHPRLQHAQSAPTKLVLVERENFPPRSMRAADGPALAATAPQTQTKKTTKTKSVHWKDQLVEAAHATSATATASTASATSAATTASSSATSTPDGVARLLVHHPTDGTWACAEALRDGCLHGLVLGRRGHGVVQFRNPVPLDAIPAGLGLDDIFRFDEHHTFHAWAGPWLAALRPTPGSPLNGEAVVHLENVWPSPEHMAVNPTEFEAFLRKRTQAMGATFLSYVTATGTWSFALDHF